MRGLLVEQFDAHLATKAHSLASQVEQETREIEFDYAHGSLPEFAAEEEPQYFQLWLLPREGDGSGEVLGRSRSLAGGDLPRGDPSRSASHPFDLDLPDGRPGRALTLRTKILKKSSSFGLGPPPDRYLDVVVARGREPLDRALASLLGWTLGGALVWMAGVVLVGRRVVDRGLRPLDELARHVEAITDPVRAREVDAERAPRELRPVAEGLNHLLDRVRTALERERRTTANIAHELRTPISELVILADVARRYADDPAELVKALEEVHEIGTDMGDLVATLLELARAEAGAVTLEIEPLELGSVVEDCWRHHEPAARARGMRFDGPGPGGPRVASDRAALTIVVSNLLGNAVAYAPPESAIDCGIQNGGAGYRLTVSNPVEGLDPGDLDKLTEPFWRASAARGDRHHAGIGLALASRLARQLDLDLSFAVDGGRFQAHVAFPGSTGEPPVMST